MARTVPACTLRGAGPDASVGLVRKAARQERRARLREAIERIRAILPAKAAALRIHRAILFGSAARGEIDGRGDIDLLVVQETDLPFVRRGVDVVTALGVSVGVDVLVYTPEEWATVQESSRFVRRAVREGVLIHASDG